MTELSAVPFRLASSEVSPKRHLIRVGGELDLNTARELRELLLRLLEAGAERISLDCAAMTFIDSAGIGVLAGAEKRARLQACELVVCRPTAVVMRALEVTGVARHLTFA